MGDKKIYNLQITADFLTSVGGGYAAQLARIYNRKGKPITDEEIGRKLPLKITEIRTILNKLHYYGIACYQKTRNPKTGWYSYAWEISAKRVATLILERQEEELEKLRGRVEYEKNYAFFSCKNSCNNVPFEIAAEYEFRCPACGAVMDAVNNKTRLRELKKRAGVLEGEIAELKKII